MSISMFLSQLVVAALEEEDSAEDLVEVDLEGEDLGEEASEGEDSEDGAEEIQSRTKLIMRSNENFLLKKNYIYTMIQYRMEPYSKQARLCYCYCFAEQNTNLISSPLLSDASQRLNKKNFSFDLSIDF